MIQIDLNIDEDVEHLESGRHGVDGDEAAVAVVDHELRPEGFGRQVVDATGAVSYVAHDQRVAAGELFQNVGDGGGENQETCGRRGNVN